LVIVEIRKQEKGFIALKAEKDIDDYQQGFELGTQLLGGGGFAEYSVGLGGQYHKVPSSIPDEVAVLTEPFTVALHAVSRNMPARKHIAMVVGAGIIGQLVIKALRDLGFEGRIISLARYPEQAKVARRLGASEIIIEKKRFNLYERVAEISGGSLLKPAMSKRVIYGNQGPDIIFDCVCSEDTVDDDLRLIKSNGKIVLVGMGYNTTKKIDWSLQIWKEVDIVGSLFSGRERFHKKEYNSFDMALKFMKNDTTSFKKLVTHTFPIEKYKKAINTAVSKGRSKSIKVAFDFR
jgi:threonine dehydrogenase-like Zn-dependent dehydrogenase